jgi:hypothetical protein
VLYRIEIAGIIYRFNQEAQLEVKQDFGYLEFVLVRSNASLPFPRLAIDPLRYRTDFHLADIGSVLLHPASVVRHFSICI